MLEDQLSEKISFSSEKIDFELEHSDTIREWIQTIVQRENKVLAAVSYIFCSDEYLYEINWEYLQHDTYTDIITFSLSDQHIESDIFISIDRVRENADSFSLSFQQELCRVIIHGILHLCGYKDKTEEEQVLMTKKEDEALDILSLSAQIF